MLNINALFYFIFLFSILSIIRVFFKFLATLLQKEPKPISLTNRELIFLGFAISYFFTYISFK